MVPKKTFSQIRLRIDQSKQPKYMLFLLYTTKAQLILQHLYFKLQTKMIEIPYKWISLQSLTFDFQTLIIISNLTFSGYQGIIEIH